MSARNKATYNKDNYENWTVNELRDALKKLGINVPSTLSKTVLKSLYKENANSATNVDRRSRSRSPVVRPVSPANVGLDAGPVSPANVVLAAGPSESPGFKDCLTTLNSTMNAFTETVKRLNDVSTGPSNPSTSQETRAIPTLRDIYSPSTIQNANGTYTESSLDYLRHLAAKSQNGISANLLSTVDVVSDSIKTQILNGRDINLASLLIPNYDLDKLNAQSDPRLKRRLTIEQFRIAFGKYRRIMVQAWPHRQQELEDYENDIAKIHAFYGDRFYDYHLAFSSKAAEAVKMRIPIDWSKRDTEQFQLILGGTRARQCQHCSSTLHESEFCPNYNVESEKMTRNRFTFVGNQQRTLNTVNAYQQRLPTNRQEAQADLHGRKIYFHQGQEICNNFNSTQGCSRRTCSRSHICAVCNNLNHTKITCPKKSLIKGNPPSTTKKD